MRKISINSQCMKSRKISVQEKFENRQNLPEEVLQKGNSITGLESRMSLRSIDSPNHIVTFHTGEYSNSNARDILQRML